MIELEDLELRSEALMAELAQKGQDSVDVHVTNDQILLGIPKYLIYIASLVVPPGKVPPYTKEEERVFARLQVLYQEKKDNYQIGKKPKQPMLFKLSPKFVRTININSLKKEQNRQLSQSIDNGKIKVKNEVVIAAKTETKEEEIRRLKIVDELLATEEKETKKNISRKHKRRIRRNPKDRVTNSNAEDAVTNSSSSLTIEEESLSDIDGGEPLSSHLLAPVEDVNTACEEIIKKENLKMSKILPVLSDNLHENNEDGSKIILQSNKTFGSIENSYSNCGEELIMGAEKDDNISNFLKEIITSSPSNIIQQNKVIQFKDILNCNSKSYLEVRTSNENYQSNHLTTEDSLRKEVDALRNELEKVNAYYEDKIKEERKGFKKKLEDSIRIERDKSEERFQALQLRLYISDNRNQTLEDALDEHIAAVSHLPRRTQREGIGDSTL